MNDNIWFRGKVFSLLFLSFLIAGMAYAAEPAFHFGFKRSVDEQPASIDQEGFSDILDKNGAIFLGGESSKKLYLTFDNGYENGYTAKILDVLQAKKVPATFFVTGHFVKDQPELIKRMDAEGHTIGNHSWSHPDMTRISDQQIRDELDQVKHAVEALIGEKEMQYLRPPRGIFNDRTLRVSYEHGYTNVFWSLAYKDWEIKAQKGAEHAYNQVMKQLHPGAILLLHSVSSDNAAAMARIIDDARSRGYEFFSLDELLYDHFLP